MPIQGLPGTEFLAQIADLGFRLPHSRHGQAQLAWPGRSSRLPDA